MRTKVTRKENRGQDKGFTLIETMIAVFVLTVAILALVSVTVMVIKGNSLSKTMTTATTLARDQMETLKNTSYAGIGSTSYAAVTGFPGYERRWTVTTSTTPPNQKKIVMEVRWTWQGTPHTVALETIIAE
jgi:prepilin-type N-terminal cleavage/methylation domain-containing protein